MWMDFLLHVHPEQLRGDCVNAGQKALAFAEFRVFEEAERLPWSLCRGDIEANLRALHAMPKPQQSTAEKAWLLMEAGYSMQQLKQMVVLHGQAPWTTTMAEQQHGTAAVLSRYHQSMGSNCCRRGLRYCVEVFDCHVPTSTE